MAAEGSHAGLTAAARQARNLAMLGKTLQRQREEKEERIAMASMIIITCPPAKMIQISWMAGGFTMFHT
jgi:hypothetical protein